MRRTGIGALVLLGLLAGRDAVCAQFVMPRGGGNPFVSNPYAGFGPNAFLPGTPGVPFGPIAGTAGSNPYAPLTSAVDPYVANPYSAASAYSNPYSNPAAGPGLTLGGAADVMRAYGTVITKQEQARIIRQEYYQSRPETKKKAFDLDMYIRNNTPDFNQIQAKIAQSTLKRIQNASTPAEIVDGRSLNFLLDDVDKYHAKTTISEIPLEESILQHLNIKAAGLGTANLGMLRDGGKLTWPSALVQLLSADVRSKLEAKALTLAQNAGKGNTADHNVLADFQAQIQQAMEQLLKKANDFDTLPYMDGKRFLNDLDNARRAIDGGHARHQIQYQQMVAKGEIQNVNQLVSVMVKNGWRFATALQTDEAAYRAVHSALVAYDVAVNQQIALAEGN